MILEHQLVFASTSNNKSKQLITGDVSINKLKYYAFAILTSLFGLPHHAIKRRENE